MASSQAGFAFWQRRKMIAHTHTHKWGDMAVLSLIHFVMESIARKQVRQWECSLSLTEAYGQQLHVKVCPASEQTNVLGQPCFPKGSSPQDRGRISQSGDLFQVSRLWDVPASQRGVELPGYGSESQDHVWVEPDSLHPAQGCGKRVTSEVLFSKFNILCSSSVHISILTWKSNISHWIITRMQCSPKQTSLPTLFFLLFVCFGPNL